MMFITSLQYLNEIVSRDFSPMGFSIIFIQPHPTLPVMKPLENRFESAKIYFHRTSILCCGPLEVDRTAKLVQHISVNLA
jgi:hypothetical protein